jgi:hypothetical protein
MQAAKFTTIGRTLKITGQKLRGRASLKLVMKTYGPCSAEKLTPILVLMFSLQQLNAQPMLSGTRQAKFLRFCSVSANTAVAIFRVNVY